MADDGYLCRLQLKIGYNFTDIRHLQQALTAAGAEEKNYDGNRRLALLGEAVLQCIVVDKAHREGASRSSANEAIQSAVARKHRAERAKLLGIGTHMKSNPRQRGQASTATLSLAVSAIVGATWLDSNRDFTLSRTVVEGLGIGNLPEASIDPKAIFPEELISGSELLSSDISDDHTEASGCNIALPSPPGNAHNDQLRDHNPSLEMQDALQGDLVEEFRGYPVSLTSSTGIDYQIVLSTGLDNSAVELQWDGASVDDRSSLYSMSNPEQPEDMRWDSVSASQSFVRGSSTYPRSRSNGSPYQEYDPHEETSLKSSASFLHSAGETQISDIDSSDLAVFDGSGISRRSQTRSTRDIEGSNHTERLGSSALGTNTKKRKASVYRTVQRKSKASLLAAYVLLEKERCHNFKLPCPEQRFYLEITQVSNGSPNMDENTVELKTLYFAIASPESLVVLRDIVQAHRRSLAGNLSPKDCNIPQAERLKVIEKLNGNIAYFGLLKRCHVHRLFVDSNGSSRKTGDGFVNNTTQSIATLKHPRTGNPSYIEDAQASKAMMKEVYPLLQEDTAEYGKKYRTIRSLRKLGQRLHLLVEKFGYGIIGLLPSAPDVSAVEPILSITDGLILSMSDTAFRGFVHRLDQSQGDILREISHAVCEIVDGIFQGTLDPSMSIGLEQLGSAQIIRHPKWSPELLKLISGNLEPPHQSNLADHTA